MVSCSCSSVAFITPHVSQRHACMEPRTFLRIPLSLLQLHTCASSSIRIKQCTRTKTLILWTPLAHLGYRWSAAKTEAGGQGDQGEGCCCGGGGEGDEVEGSRCRGQGQEAQEGPQAGEGMSGFHMVFKTRIACLFLQGPFLRNLVA